jgi:hypothetical protein
MSFEEDGQSYLAIQEIVDLLFREGASDLDANAHGDILQKALEDKV